MSDPSSKPRPVVADPAGTATTGRGFDWSMRWSIYLLLIAISAGLMLARIARVRSADPKNKTPFLSANDRSRWTTIRALGDDGTYAIDHLVFDAKGQRVRGWHSIDMVRHRGPDGREHYYSSKPTLLTTLLAGEYWLIKLITGATLETQTFFVARIMLVLTNVVPLVIALILLAWLVEVGWAMPTSHSADGSVGIAHPTDFSRIFTVAAACFGTFLTTFAVTLNNHLIAAASLVFALAAIVPMWRANRFGWAGMAWAGFWMAFLAANELPALSICVFAAAALAWKAPLKTALAYLPAALVVAAAAFGTNYVAHGDWKTPYAHRKDGALVATIDQSNAEVLDRGRVPDELRWAMEYLAEARLSDEARIEIRRPSRRWELFDPATHLRYALTLSSADKQSPPSTIDVRAWDNWYDYEGSYWRAENLSGVDRGEPSRGVYALNVLVGHHGIFSLTPIWLLSVYGCGLMLTRRKASGRREPPGTPPSSIDPHDSRFALAAGTLLITLIVVGFYLMRPQLDRNYGGVTCCLRWLIWLTPLWLLTLLPAADRLSRSWPGRAALLALLAVSVLSAHYAADNPWSHPWIFDYWTALRWINY